MFIKKYFKYGIQIVAKICMQSLALCYTINLSYLNSGAGPNLCFVTSKVKIKKAIASCSCFDTITNVVANLL